MNPPLHYFLLVTVSVLLRTCVAKLIRTKSETLPFDRKSMALVFAATVRNDGTDEESGKIPARLEAIRCCQEAPMLNGDKNTSKATTDQDCESMNLHSGLAFHIKSQNVGVLKAFFLNKVLLNRKGSCQFRIHGAKNIDPFEILFDTKTNNQSTNSNGTPRISTCSFIDQDSSHACRPVNCIQKYLGFRSRYNEGQQRCEPTAECTVDDAVAANISAMERKERKPIQVLDLNENKCRNRTVYKIIKTRAVLDEEEEKASVGMFTLAYSTTLAKLLIAIALTIIFIFVICVICNFLFGFYASCGILKRKSSQKCSVPHYKPPPDGKSGIKYSRIPEEESNPETAAQVIEEVKDRREMKPRASLNERTSPEMYASPEESRRPSYNEMAADESEGWSLRSSRDSHEHAKPTSRKQSQQITPMTVSKKLPKVDTFLNQLQNFNRKKSNGNAPHRLNSELQRAYGNALPDRRRYPHPQTDSMPRKIPRANSQLIHVGSTPVIHSSIHKIQEEASGSGGKYQDTHKLPQSTQPRPQARSIKRIIPTAASSALINPVETERMPSSVNFSHWANIPSDDSVHRLYKTEMAKAATFLRELDQRRQKSEPQSPQGLIRVLPKRDAGTMMAYGDHRSTLAVQTTGRTKEDACQTNLTIRRIKEEPPIPMSMIHSKAKIAISDTGSSDSNEGVHEGHQYPIIPGAVGGSPGEMIVGFVSMNAAPLPPNPAQAQAKIARSLPAEFRSRSRSLKRDNQNIGNRSAQDESTGRHATHSPPGGGENFNPSLPMASFSKSPAAKNLYESALKLHQTVVNSKFPYESQLQLDQGTGSGPTFQFSATKPKPDYSNHSPQYLSTSNSSCELSGSEAKYKESPWKACFFDNDLLPARTASRSDEVLHSRMWIDSFKTKDK